MLFKAKNTSLGTLKRAGVLVDERGKVRLLAREELPAAWDPRTASPATDWAGVQHLARAMTAEDGGGGAEAARLVQLMGGARAERARALAYRLFKISSAPGRQGGTQDALAMNVLVVSWPEISDRAARLPGPAQPELALGATA